MQGPPIMLNLVALAVVAIVLLMLIGFAVATGVMWSRTRSLAWRVDDLEHAVRQLQQERPLPRDVSGSSTAIRE